MSRKGPVGAEKVIFVDLSAILNIGQQVPVKAKGVNTSFPDVSIDNCDIWRLWDHLARVGRQYVRFA